MDYRARLYDPALKRFIQPDSIIPGMGASKNLNRYSYVGNSPIGFSDPTGHKACGDAESTECDGTKSPNPKHYVPLSNAGKGVDKLFSLFKKTDGYWQKDIKSGKDPFTLFIAILLSRESGPLWTGDANWKVENGVPSGSAKWFSDATSHWLGGWVKDNYHYSFSSLSESGQMNAAFNLLGTMESVEGVVNASQGVHKIANPPYLEPDSQYSGLPSDGDRLKKVLKEDEYSSDLYGIASNALSHPATGYWTWGNESPVPADSVFHFDNFYILDHYR